MLLSTLIISDIQKAIKAIKCEYIAIYPDGLVLGTDSALTILVQTSIKTTGIRFCSDCQTLNNFFKVAIAGAIYRESENILVDPNVSTAMVYNNSIFGINMFNKFMQICQEIGQLGPNDISGPDVLTKTDEFNRIFSLKSDDGAIMMNSNLYLMSMFNGLISVNKSDTLTRTIYNVNSYSFITKFDIEKKGITTSTYIRYLKM